MFTRQKKYIRGSLRKLKRKRVPDVYEWRYSDRNLPGSPLTAMTFSTVKFPTKAAHVEAHRLFAVESER